MIILYDRVRGGHGVDDDKHQNTGGCVDHLFSFPLYFGERARIKIKTQPEDEDEDEDTRQIYMNCIT
jgi:hypothetical protein